MKAQLRRDRRQAPRRPAQARELRPRRRHRESQRQPRPRRAEHQERRRARLRRLLHGVRGNHPKVRTNELTPEDFAGHDGDADEPRHRRDAHVGAAADASSRV